MIFAYNNNNNDDNNNNNMCLYFYNNYKDILGLIVVYPSKNMFFNL